jgi:hypothetical protein
MKRLLFSVVMTALVSGLTSPVRGADDKEAQAVLDKAIKALGGADKLGSLQAMTWKGKGTMSFRGQMGEFTSTTTVQGLDHLRLEFEFEGNNGSGVTVLSGDKGWRKFGDRSLELDKDGVGVANEKRLLYLQVIPVTLVPLKGKAFKVKAAAPEKVGDKPAAVLKVTGPDGKDFKVYFDQESGLPVRLVAKVIGYTGGESEQDTAYAGYKDFGGIKKATKLESKRDGEKFLEVEITDFKPVDKVDPKTFTEPK